MSVKKPSQSLEQRDRCECTQMLSAFLAHSILSIASNLTLLETLKMAEILETNSLPVPVPTVNVAVLPHWVATIRQQ